MNSLINKIEFCPNCGKILIEKKFGTLDNGCIFNICGDYLNCSYFELVKLTSTLSYESQIKKEERRYKNLLENFIKREKFKNNIDLKQTHLGMAKGKNISKKNDRFKDTNKNKDLKFDSDKVNVLEINGTKIEFTKINVTESQNIKSEDNKNNDLKVNDFKIEEKKKKNIKIDNVRSNDAKIDDSKINATEIKDTDDVRKNELTPKYPIAIEKIISNIFIIQEEINNFKVSEELVNIKFQKNRLRGILNKIFNDKKILKRYIARFREERDIIYSYIKILNKKEHEIEDLFHDIKLKERDLVKDKYEILFNSDTLLKENFTTKYFSVDEIIIGLHIIKEIEDFNSINQEKERQRKDYLKKLSKSNLKKKEMQESYKSS